MNNDQAVINHYAPTDAHNDIGETILRALAHTGKDTENLAPEDLAAADEFHIGGRMATQHLMASLPWQTGINILDVGSGLGGATRFVAATTGAHVTGIDLTPEYCRAATMLSEKTGLAAHTIYKQGSALAMPFADAAFDGAYSIHTAMNIADKAALYRETARCLKPGALFGIYDVLRGANPAPLAFPVPWATNASESHLATIEEMRQALSDAGLKIQSEENRGHPALAALQKLQASNPEFGPRLVIGDRYDEKIENLIQNIQAGRCSPWIIICQKIEP